MKGQVVKTQDNEECQLHREEGENKSKNKNKNLSSATPPNTLV